MSLHSKANIRFIEFLRPDSYWPQPYTIEQAFQVFRWMVKTGARYQRHDYSGVFELLSLKPTCSSFGRVDPITSIQDLKARFHYALLSSDASRLADKWRNDHKINAMGEQWIRFPYRDRGDWTDSEAEIKKKLTTFLETKGMLAVQLNPSHPGAKEIKQISIQIWGDRFEFVLEYGYKGSSRWHHTLADTTHILGITDECFITTFTRAVENLDALRNDKKSRNNLMSTNKEDIYGGLSNESQRAKENTKQISRRPTSCIVER